MLYNNASSLHKKRCRELIFLEVTKRFRRRGLEIITLPNTNYELEKALLKKYPDSWIVLVEHKRSIAREIAVHFAGTDVVVYNDDIFKLLFGGGQFNVIWIDLCSPISITLIGQLKLLFLVQENAVIAVTVTQKRENVKGLLNVWPYANIQELRREFPSLVTTLTNYELKTRYAYKSELKKNSFPMETLIFARK